MIQGGALIQKIKHELINPLPGKPPRYDNIVIAVGKDRAKMATNMAAALMKAVNKFQGYEHVKVTPYITERDESAGGTGISFSNLRNALKSGTPEQQYQIWKHGFDEAKLGKEWIEHLMNLTRQGMGLHNKQEQPPADPLNIKEANNWIRKMRAKEFLAEISTMPSGDRHENHKDASQGYILSRDVGGYDRTYHLNRIMMATAMADGKSKKPVKMPDSSFVEKYNVAFPYTEEERLMMFQAMATIPTDGGELEKRAKSQESKDTNKISPVNKPKRNRYGV